MQGAENKERQNLNNVLR